MQRGEQNMASTINKGKTNSLDVQKLFLKTTTTKIRIYLAGISPVACPHCTSWWELVLLHPQILFPVESHISKDSTLAMWCGCKSPHKGDFVAPSGSLDVAIYLLVSSFQKTCKMNWEEVKKVKGKYLRHSALEQRL